MQNTITRYIINMTILKYQIAVSPFSLPPHSHHYCEYMYNIWSIAIKQQSLKNEFDVVLYPFKAMWTTCPLKLRDGLV